MKPARQPAPTVEPSFPPRVQGDELQALLRGDHAEPHRILGPRAARRGRREGVLIRAYHPAAIACDCLVGDESFAMAPLGDGIFATFLRGAAIPLRYRLRFHFSGGSSWERGDPYAFPPTLGEQDLHFFGEGTHRRLWQVLGAHCRRLDEEADHLLAVLNFTPVPRDPYRIGAPHAGHYRERLSSDDKRYHGSDFESLPEVETEPVAFHGQSQSLLLRLPPFGALILAPAP